MWQHYFQPATLDEVLALLGEHGAHSRIVAGGTDVMVELQRGIKPTATLIDVSRLRELKYVRLDDGVLRLGSDADLVVVDLEWSGVLRADDLHYRHPHSPYTGRQLRGKVLQTLVRGTTVWDQGTFVAPPAGRLIRPRSAQERA